MRRVLVAKNASALTALKRCIEETENNKGERRKNYWRTDVNTI